jgi:hypothetical protein
LPVLGSYENHQFFEAFEMVGIDGSLILIFLPRIGTDGGSLILEFLMLQESMVLRRIAQHWL